MRLFHLILPPICHVAVCVCRTNGEILFFQFRLFVGEMRSKFGCYDNTHMGTHFYYIMMGLGIRTRPVHIITWNNGREITLDIFIV